MAVVVRDVLPPDQYVAIASQTAFTVSFSWDADADIIVYKDGVKQTITTHYTLAKAADPSDGGTCTFVSAMSGGEIITIDRDTAVKRLTDFTNSGEWTAANVNDELDNIVRMIQDQEAKMNRSVKIDPFDYGDQASPSFDPTFPVPVAGKILAVNAAGTGFTLSTDSLTDIEASLTASETLASEWASKTDGIVDGTDYSAKAWSIGGTGVTNTASRGAAKEWATKTGGTVDTSEYSAKHYSQASSTSATASANSAAAAAASATAAANSATAAAASATAAAASAASVNIVNPIASKHGALLYQNDDDNGYDSLTAQGTSSQVLTSNGPDAAPSWQDAAGGAWTLLSTQTASNDATIDFTSNIDTTYKNYVVIGSNIVPATDNTSLWLRHSVSSTFQTLGYNSDYEDRSGGSTGNSATKVELFSANIDSTEGCSFMLYAFDPAGSSYTHYYFNGHLLNSASAGNRYSTGGGGDNNARALDGLRFLFSSGNITSGTFKLYGIS